MKSFKVWAPAVALSLLYHAVLAVLITFQFANNSAVPMQDQAITISLLGSKSEVANKSNTRKINPVALAESVQQPQKTEQISVQNSVPDVSNTPTTQITQLIQATAESTQASLKIQPRSKLTRQPTFLHQVEPIYPGAEQRSGGQAYVLAEVTIDSTGKVLEVKFAKSAGINFDSAVKEALNNSFFVPGYIDKEAVAVRVYVPFRFKLK